MKPRRDASGVGIRETDMNWKIWVPRVTLIGCLLAAGAAVWGYKANWWRPEKPGPFAGFEPAQTVQAAPVGTGSCDGEHGRDRVRPALDHREQRGCRDDQGSELDSGSVIEEGQPLLILDTLTEEADLKAAEAAIKASEASHEMVVLTMSLAESNFRRVTDAAKQNAISAMEVDKAKSEVDSAKANLDRMMPTRASRGQRPSKCGQSSPKSTSSCALQGADGYSQRASRPVFEGRNGSRFISGNRREGVPRFRGASGGVVAREAGAVFMCTSPNLGPQPVAITVAAPDSQINMATRNVRVVDH